jgi:outer membrane autotransporter protein
MKNITVAVSLSVLVIATSMTANAQKADFGFLRSDDMFINTKWENLNCPPKQSVNRRAFAFYTETSDQQDNADWELDTSGFTVGTDIFHTNYYQIGLLAQYKKAVQDSPTKLGVIGKDYTFGGYGIMVFQYGIDARVTIAGTSQSYLTLFQPEFIGRGIETSVEFGKQLQCGDRNVFFRPYIALDIFYNEFELKGNPEKAKGTQVLPKIGLEYRADFLQRFSFFGGVSYAFDCTDNAHAVPLFVSSTGMRGDVFQYNAGLTWKDRKSVV